MVAAMVMPASADLVAHYKGDDVFFTDGWNYTTNEVAGWGDALINQSAGVPVSSAVEKVSEI